MQYPPLLTPFYEAKGIMAQAWQRWFNLMAGNRFVDRGDPSAADFSLTDLTTDGTWRDLSLTTPVAKGAIAVALWVSIQDDAASSDLSFRKNGNTNAINIASIRTQVANVIARGDLIVPLDAGRVIEYMATNVTWTAISIVVKGWWL